MNSESMFKKRKTNFKLKMYLVNYGLLGLIKIENNNKYLFVLVTNLLLYELYLFGRPMKLI